MGGVSEGALSVDDYINAVNFEWSDAKCTWVLNERGIDFPRIAEMLFDGHPILIKEQDQ